MATSVEATGVAHARAGGLTPVPTTLESRVGWLFAGTGLLLFGLMGLAGIGMRLTQADVLGLSSEWVYRLLTVHGAGMLVGAMLVMMGGLWFVVRPVIVLTVGRLLWSYALMVAGAGLVVVAVLAGGYATGWTFLWPLPVHAAGQWSSWASWTFFVGMVLVGVGFFVYCLELFTATTSQWGGLSSALGIPYLRGREEAGPPPQVIAATVVALEGLLAGAVGTTVLIAIVDHLLDGTTSINALWAKNLTYMFGHTFANLIIYLAAGIVYVLLPRYAGRPWKTTKPIVVGWLATLVLVATAFSHHLYMDFVQPRWAEYVSMGASSAAAIPVAVVTIYTAVMLIWGSGYRWTLASTLLYIGFAGWAIGGVGAVLDSLIPVNARLHNTLWVPAHFHTYLMLGAIFWVMAFAAHLAERAAGRTAGRAASIAAPALMTLGGAVLVGAWYASGALGIPRRYAVQPLGTDAYSAVGAAGAAIFAVGFLVYLTAVGRLVLAARGSTAEAPAPPRVPAARPALVPPVRTDTGFAVLAGLTVITFVSLLPPAVNEATRQASWHHVDHSAQFLLGALVALGLGSRQVILRPRPADPPGWAIATVVVAPVAMLLLMTPGIYRGLERDDFVHLLYHQGIILLGFATGWACVRLGRVSGLVVLTVSVAMGVMFAAGVTGG